MEDESNGREKSRPKPGEGKLGLRYPARRSLERERTARPVADPEGWST